MLTVHYLYCLQRIEFIGLSSLAKYCRKIAVFGTNIGSYFRNRDIFTIARNELNSLECSLDYR